MRDPNRIYEVCSELARIWSKVPDWRLSQLITNAFVIYYNRHGHDAFYVEDDDFIKFLEDFIKEAIGENA